MKLKQKILDQTGDISMFDRLTHQKPPSQRQVILKYKVLCDHIAHNARRKQFPYNYPKLMRSRVKEQDRPGVGTYRQDDPPHAPSAVIGRAGILKRVEGN